MVRDHVRKKKEIFVSKCKIWKLKESNIQKEFKDIVQDEGKVRVREEGNVEGLWKRLSILLQFHIVN